MRMKYQTVIPLDWGWMASRNIFCENFLNTETLPAGFPLEKSSWIKILVFRFSSTSISSWSRSSLVGVGGCSSFSRTLFLLARNWLFIKAVCSVICLNFSSPSLEFRIFRSGSSTLVSADMMTNGNLFADIVLHLFKSPTFTTARLLPTVSFIELKFPYLAHSHSQLSLTDLRAGLVA